MSELSLSINDFSIRYLQPAIKEIAGKMLKKSFKQKAIYGKTKQERRHYRAALRDYA